MITPQYEPATSDNSDDSDQSRQVNYTCLISYRREKKLKWLWEFGYRVLKYFSATRADVANLAAEEVAEVKPIPRDLPLLAVPILFFFSPSSLNFCYRRNATNEVVEPWFFFSSEKEPAPRYTQDTLTHTHTRARMCASESQSEPPPPSLPFRDSPKK